MSYLSRLEEAQKHADGVPSKGSEGAFAGFEGMAAGLFHGLAPDLADGLTRLRMMSPPRITRPAVWPVVVADALRLASEGWAAQALALGWEPVQLWGCSPDKGGNPDHDGLAVLLCERRIVVLDDRSALIESQAGARRLFNRRPMVGAVLLWDIGRGK